MSTVQPKTSTPDSSNPDFSTINLSTQGSTTPAEVEFKNSEVEMSTVQPQASPDSSNPDFSTINLSTPVSSTPDFSTINSSNPDFSTMNLELKSSGLKIELENSGDENFGVEMSCDQPTAPAEDVGHDNPAHQTE